VKPLFTMREALADPALLGDALPGESWRAWRILLIAAVGEALTDDERVTFKALTGREREPGQMVEVFLAVAGRRSGKSRAMSVLSVYLAALVDWSADLALGERGIALYLAPTERQAAVAHRYSAELLDHVELLRTRIIDRTMSTVELRGGIDLETQPASWKHSRGFTAISIVLDEAAYLPTAADAKNADTEIVQALKPSLSTTGGPLIITSSPATLDGIVYRLWKRHHGADGDPRCLVVQADTKTLNPSLRQSVIDRAYEEDAVAAAAEYGGEFREPLTGYLARDMIEGAVDAGITQRVPLPGVVYFGFVDTAGGSGQDSYTLAIGHKQRDGDRDICIIDALAEQRPPFNPDYATASAAALLKAYGIRDVFGDAYAGAWPQTAFARHGRQYLTSPLTASELYLHSLPAWTAGRVRMLENARAVDQLAGLRRRIGQGGRETVVHQRGAHDDLSNAIAGLIWRLTPVEQAMPTSWANIGVVFGPRIAVGSEDTTAPWLRSSFGRRATGVWP